MTEKQIEAALVKYVKTSGGIALKLLSPGWAGIPDRLVLFPGGRIIFVELKRPGEKPRLLQQKRHKQLSALGFKVLVIDNKEVIQKRKNKA